MSQAWDKRVQNGSSRKMTACQLRPHLFGENESQVEKIAEQLKTKGGGFSLVGSGPEDPSKHLRRATVLAEIALGRFTIEQIPARKAEIDKLTPAMVSMRLSTMYNRWAQTQPMTRLASTPTVKLAGSFRLANSLEQYQTTPCISQAALLLDSSIKALKLVKGSLRARSAYVRWFGAFKEDRHRRVAANFDRLADAVIQKELWLYYRGRGLKNDKRIEAAKKLLAGTPPKMPKGFVSAVPTFDNKQLIEELGHDMIADREKRPQPDDCFGYVYTGAGRDRRFVFFANMFYETSQKMGTDNAAGVFIHELSHAICGTFDTKVAGKPCYGGFACSMLAKFKPEDACNNADNYEYFAEEWQSAYYDLDAKYKEDQAVKIKHKVVTKLSMRLEKP